MVTIFCQYYAVLAVTDRTVTLVDELILVNILNEWMNTNQQNDVDFIHVYFFFQTTDSMQYRPPKFRTQTTLGTAISER